ncbi:MAG: sugar ABC transporter substrate-binding protein [Anaerolineales bacterium]|nr:sugar ABC transporter substrate-binding protein [Anaerolineales bacterium]
MKKQIGHVFSFLTILSLVLTGCAPAATQAPKVTELKILWAQWSPADYLQQIGNEYEKATGIKVTVVQEPWATFGDRFFTEMAAKGTSWDMVVGDSQWLGQGATQGLYLDMTDFMKSNGIDKTVTPATLKYYGEYPANSGKYYGYPTEGDADGWAYRKDLFEDPKEQADFKAQYGYDLAVPKTYAQLMDIAKFFTRPDQGIFGLAIYTQKGYDAMTMGVENTFFAFGATWQDANNNVKGVVNSPQAIEALQFYKDLYDCCQVPGLSDAFFTETNDAMIGGKAAMIMNYFAFFPALVNEGTNPNYWDKVGFFASPAGPTGVRAAALGGQGTSIISFISPERQAAAKDFIKWFATDEIQQKWADLGGYTCNAKVLASDKFLQTTPFNPAFAETMTFVADFWNIPEFGRLLEVTQNELHAFVVGGEGTAQEALDAIAEQHDQILRETGYIK